MEGRANTSPNENHENAHTRTSGLFVSRLALDPSAVAKQRIVTHPCRQAHAQPTNLEPGWRVHPGKTRRCCTSVPLEIGATCGAQTARTVTSCCALMTWMAWVWGSWCRWCLSLACLWFSGLAAGAAECTVCLTQAHCGSTSNGHPLKSTRQDALD